MGGLASAHSLSGREGLKSKLIELADRMMCRARQKPRRQEMPVGTTHALTAALGLVRLVYATQGTDTGHAQECITKAP